MSLFAAREGVVVEERRSAEFFSVPCSVVAQVVGVHAGRSADPKKAGLPYIIVTFEVVEARDGDLVPGDRRAYYRALQGEHNLQAVLSMTGALTQNDPNTVSISDLEGLFLGDDPPAVGLKCRIVAVHNRKGAINQKTGLPWLDISFGPAVGSGDFDPGF
jgi:hypothetical protein